MQALSIRSRVGYWRPLTALLSSCLFLSSAVVGAPAQASQLSPGADAASPAFEILEDRLIAPKSYTDNRNFVIAQDTGVAYFLQQVNPPPVIPPIHWSTGATDLSPPSKNPAPRNVVGVDIATGQEIGRGVLDPPGLAAGAEGEKLIGPESMAVDEERGLLYVLYAQPRRHSAGGALAHYGLTSVNGASHVCAYTGAGRSEPPCVAGVHVFDTASLTLLRSVALPNAFIGAAILAPRALAVEASDGKVRLLVVDQVNEVPAPDGTARDWSPHFVAPSNLHHLLQIDAERGTVDWIVRLDGCRGTRDRTASGYFMTSHLPAPGLVFRSPLDPDAIFVGCHNSSARTGTIVRVPVDDSGQVELLPVEMDPSAGVPDPSGPAAPTAEGVRPAPPQENFFGPDQTLSILADRLSGRILLRVVDAKQEVWWVFDVAMRRFIGTIGLGDRTLSPGGDVAIAGLDDRTGRLYSLSRDKGLFAADVRRSPVPQALHFPELATIAPPGGYGASIRVWQLPSGEARLLVPNGLNPKDGNEFTYLNMLRDARPLAEELVPVGEETRTVDLEEREGVTAASYDGTARGYGARVLLVGGIDAIARVGPADPPGFAYDVRDNNNIKDNMDERGLGDERNLIRSPCTDGNRDVTLAFVGPDGPAVVDVSGGRASSQAIVTDSALRADSEATSSRCAPVEWEDLWRSALFGGPPTGEPELPWLFGDGATTCLSSSDEQSADSFSDPVTGKLASAVACEGTESSGWAQVRGLNLQGLQVGQALSSFRIYRDPGRGIVARIESTTRGVAIDGVVRIDTIRAVAESWANGRRQPVAEADRPADYDANCDAHRTAGTCYRRHLFGVWTPAYHCGPCGDENRLISAMNRAMGVNGVFAFREPDPLRARGSEAGFQAAISKNDAERFADLVLNNDLLQTIVPTLEFVRFAPPNRPTMGGGTRGRQIFQFAGVEVSSSYGIACLLVYDEASNTCEEAADVPGSITVSLGDPEGRPLAGGVFEVRRDTDIDGVVGLVDELVGEGACVTTEDGIGSCAFENLQPGSYLVSQTAAPAGYSAVAEPWVSEVASGETRTVAFTNVSDVSTVELSAVDGDGDPVEGATFAVFADPDADGKVAPHATPVATCTTDASGVCAMSVPAGSYVLVQTVAPADMDPIEPVAFAFASGGQTAAVGVVNQPIAEDGQPVAPVAPVAAAPISYTGPPVIVPTEGAAGYEPPPASEEPVASMREQVGGTVVRVIGAPGDALRLLARDSKQALAWVAALGLFALAVLTVRRRQLLGTLLAAPVFAFTGPSGPPPTSGASRKAHPAGSPSRASGASTHAATGVLERPPVIAGAAPAPAELVSVTVVAATSTPGLGTLISQKLTVAERCDLRATVASLDRLRQALQRHTPDVLVIDLELLPPDVELGEFLAQLHQPQRIVGLLSNPSSFEHLLADVWTAGLGGLLVTDNDLTNGQLGFTVRQVAVGHRCYGPKAQTILASSPARAVGNPVVEDVPYLTKRELQVARLAARGLRHVISRRLFISDQTVKIHLRRARQKLGVDNPRDFHALRRRLEHFGLLDDDADTPPI